MAKVTVLMPSLNVVNYIRECLDSVISQTLQDIEIICIDAGSTDGTLEILNEYASKDSRIRLIHSEKKSYGYQMNVGIREATSEYIGVVETDDFIRPQMYEVLFRTAKEHDADFVKSDFDVFVTSDDGNRMFLTYSMRRESGLKYNCLYSSEDYIQNKSTVDVYIWNGIYRRNFLLDNHIWLQETPGAAFQDCGFRYQVALFVQKGIFLEESFYCYRRDNMGSSTYNNKTVLFNLSECKNLLSIAEKKGINDSDTLSFLAREMFVIANHPYIELLRWKEPAEGTREALEEFRKIFRDFERRGLLSFQSMDRNLWLQYKIFMGEDKFYDYYAHLKADAEADAIKSFVKKIRNYKNVIIFGSGLLGRSAYCLLRVNHVDTIVAFADNAVEKWGTREMGCLVDEPQKLVFQYQDACYLISTLAHRREIRDQLLDYGVPSEHIYIYQLGSFPLDCTNVCMDEEQVEQGEI